jgi:hypothetical protein
MARKPTVPYVPPAAPPIEQNAYPRHAKDGGPLLPTKGAGLVCGRCHEVIVEPDFGVLRQAREAHQKAGCAPVNVDREIRTPWDLTAEERSILMRAANGGAMRLSPAKAAPLVALGLLEEQRSEVPGIGVVARPLGPRGHALVQAIREAEKAKPQAVPLLDIGPPDPRYVPRRGGKR